MQKGSTWTIYFETRRSLTIRVKELIASAINLELQATDIDEDAPLFGAGLGLDSLDALELVVAIEGAFDTPQPIEGTRDLFSVNTIVEFLLQQGVTQPQREAAVAC